MAEEKEVSSDLKTAEKPEENNSIPKKTPKKHTARNIFIGLFIALILLITGPVLIAGYFGLVPGLSTLMGVNKPKDLNVTYTQADYQSFLAKTKTNLQDFANAPANPEKPNKKVVFADPVTANNVPISQEELTAAINESGWVWMPIDNAQVKISDGIVEMSGNLKLDNIANFVGFIGGVGYSQSDIDTAVSWAKRFINNSPIYIKANGSVTNNQLQLTVQEFKIGRYNVPADIAQTVLQAGTQSAIKNTPLLSAQSATLTNGALVFTGTHPSTIYVKTQ